MYQVSIPINCDKFYRTKDKHLILDELKAFDADRVMLNFETALDGHVVLFDEKDYQRQIDHMSEACAFLSNTDMKSAHGFGGFNLTNHFLLPRSKH